MIRELSLLGAGAVAALTLVLSCSDDSPGDADAAVCDCPSLMVVQDVRPGQGGSPGLLTAVATCPASYTVVGGGCQVNSGDESGLRLVSAGFRSTAPPEIYACFWDNPAGTTTTVTAWATCQSPAQ